MTDSGSLSGKRCALVTGGGRGIGFKICRKLAENEIRVILTDRKQKDAIEAVEKLKLSGNLDVVSHQLDVKDSASIAAVANYVKSNFGKLDILVNNAGASGLVIAKPQELRSFKDGAGFLEVIDEHAHLLEGILEENYELAEDCLRTNYYGTKAVTTELLPLLQLSNSARIVNVSSNYGELKWIYNEKVKAELNNVETLTEEKIDEIIKWFLKVYKENNWKANGWPIVVSPYKISKAAVSAYTRLLARKYPDMLINCVHPGYCKTEITSESGPLTPEEGARAPVMLALLPNDGPSGIYFAEMQPSTF
ncbi:short-chain dehydrogenase/reductase 2b [Daucus carota subsp. sativus]|uniref:short-chain dehydrogenase/reductase 2b n=1 Tax=Daucus carota subsp. sativus TaxID=79200 RepID=UPI0007B2E2FB|nr:PREDICTED: short-chain dehydrogenase/reductase 2b-like [Daucus carota subsp. sativus]